MRTSSLGDTGAGQEFKVFATAESNSAWLVPETIKRERRFAKQFGSFAADDQVVAADDSVFATESTKKGSSAPREGIFTSRGWAP